MSKKSQTKNYILIGFFCLVAILLKWYFISQRGYEMDIMTFLEWSGKVAHSGFWSLYGSGYQSGLDYPPLVPLVASYWTKLTPFFHLDDLKNFKLLPTLAEVIFSAITAFFVYRSNFKYKFALLALVIIQPALGLITSAWGQVDSILSLFIICGFLFFERNLYLASFFLFLAFLTKPQAVFAIFIFFVAVLFKKGITNFAKTALFWVALVGIMVLLFNSRDSDFLSVYFMSTGRYPYASMNAFNLWWLFLGARASSISDAAGLISYKTVGFILFGAFLAPGIYFLYRKAKSLPDYFLVLAYTYIIFFVFPTQIHERYIYPALALLPFAVIRDNKLFWLYLILSGTLILNNYAVLQSAFPQFPVLEFLAPEKWLGNWTVLVAGVNVFIAIYLAYYLINESLTER